LPFSRLHLRGPRPRSLPRGYPTEVRTLGDHLRKRRLDLGLWQRTVAEQLGVREETVVLWENGLARPLARHYCRIVRFLGYDPEPGDQSLAGRLRTIRRRLGLSQADFAAKVGLDEGSVCRWESGSRQPSRWMATRLEAMLAGLETGQGISGLRFYDLTRWRRRLPMDAKPKTLGDHIRARRLELGITQEEAGRRFGVGRVTVYRWERGECDPPRRLRLLVRRFLSRGQSR
jgi:transcriptional regulator with XRE-family HTH domain